jgi:hypothetical protein
MLNCLVPSSVTKFFAQKHVLLVVWSLIAIAILWLDYLTGPDIAFPYFFLVPVVLAARFNGGASGYLFAVSLPLIRFSFLFVWDEQISLRDALLNTAIRLGVLLAAAFLVDRVTRQAREIQVLRGCLPICSVCKKIRDSNQRWSSVETYISKHSEAEFSHTICPDCGKRHYREWSEEAGARNAEKRQSR